MFLISTRTCCGQGRPVPCGCIPCVALRDRHLRKATVKYIRLHESLIICIIIIIIIIIITVIIILINAGIGNTTPI